MKNRKGFELAISAVILMIIAIFVLIGLSLFLATNWERFSDTVKGYFGSEEQRAVDLCGSQCSLKQEYDFCCATKEVDGIQKTCFHLNISCLDIDCKSFGCG